mmetsp:Transcript_17023/g.30369  ORF Transcript_17023/g.30369 Transcript_17023/m.30369 type:complete len:216 (+) Transcript_17023:513-1160(+)
MLQGVRHDGQHPVPLLLLRHHRFGPPPLLQHDEGRLHLLAHLLEAFREADLLDARPRRCLKLGEAVALLRLHQESLPRLQCNQHLRHGPQHAFPGLFELDLPGTKHHPLQVVYKAHHVSLLLLGQIFSAPHLKPHQRLHRGEGRQRFRGHNLPFIMRPYRQVSVSLGLNLVDTYWLCSRAVFGMRVFTRGSLGQVHSEGYTPDMVSDIQPLDSAP